MDFKIVDGIVTRIVDGDTIVVTILNIEPLPQLFMDFPRIHLRLTAINAPEKWTADGKNSIMHMTNLALDKKAKILLTGRKSFNRFIAEVVLEDGTNLSIQMVEDGYAEYYAY